MSSKEGQPSNLKRDPRTGIWSYRRVVPPRLRAAVGKAEIRRSLGISSDRFGSREFKAAYARAKSEVEQILLQAEHPQPLTTRDQYGLVREVLLTQEMDTSSSLVKALETQLGQQLPSQEPVDPSALLQQVLQKGQEIAGPDASLPEICSALLIALKQSQEDLRAKQERLAQSSDLLQRIDERSLDEVTKRLGLHLTPEQRKQMVGFMDATALPLAEKRQAEINEGNLNSVGGVYAGLPDPPKPSTTWEVLKQAWIDRRGGIAAVDGHGLSQESLTRAEAHWREIKAISGVFAPSDVTTEMLRDWLKWQRQLGRVPGTIKSNLAIVKAIWSVGLKEGLLQEDVSVNLSVSAPRVAGYAPFNGDQVRMILKATERSELDYPFWLPRLALYTGSRIEEMAQLTPDDLIQHKGVWAIHLKHDPAGKYPKSLKGKELNERMVPLHPWILSLGFVELVQKQGEGYIFKGSGGRSGTIGTAASRWHHNLLVRLGIYEKRKFVFHSWRGTCKDMCRRYGVREVIHHAMTGHSTGNVGDTSYGQTLRFMPDVIFEEIKMLPTPDKLDLG